MTTFAERLKQTRLEKGIKIEELAEKLGVATNTVYIWERGEWPPADMNVVKLSSALSVPLEYLRGESDDKEYHDRLSDEEAAAVAEAEEQERFDSMISRYKDLSAQTQELVRGMINAAWRTDKFWGKLQSQQTDE